MISGVVENGKRLGRTIGFPTANILADPGTQLPVNGVYAGALWLDGENDPRPCMVNLGAHPTVPDGKPTLEAHILNFAGDIYGRRVRLALDRYLRAEKRFDGLDALRAQLESDRENALAWASATGDIYRWQGLIASEEK